MSCQSVPPVSSHRQAQSSSTYVLGEGRAGRGGEALPPATAIIIALPPPLPSSPSLSHHHAYGRSHGGGSNSGGGSGSKQCLLCARPWVPSILHIFTQSLTIAL